MGFDTSKLVLRCVSCGSLYGFDPFMYSCPRCGGLLEVVGYDNPRLFNAVGMRLPGIWRFHEALPTPPSNHIVSLGEGRTPLVNIEGSNAWIKFEGSNPTGSFKDRGMTVASSFARWGRVIIVISASTGNTAASMAAYAARGGLRALVVVPRGGVARGKLFQVMLHGGIIVQVDGVFDDALKMVMDAVGRWRRRIYSMNSINPVRLEGQKTLAYEIVEELGEVPDYVVVPVGNAGNISAIWKGFKELEEWGYIRSLPIMVGVQASGASPLYKTWMSGGGTLIPVEEPRTIASAIRIGKPVNWVKAIKALRESGGFIVTVSDEEIISGVREVARRVGLGVEPSSAAPYAAWKKLLDEGRIARDDTVVLIATGHALKDPGIISHVESRMVEASSTEGLDNIIKSIIGDESVDR